MQIQNIRDFVRRMPDILGRHEQIQPYGNCNRAAAQAVITTKAGHRYKMEVVAAYASNEPNGLGQILLRGPGDYRVVQGVDSNGQVGPRCTGGGGEAVRGPMKDETWATIVQYIRDRENGVPLIPPPPDPTVVQPVSDDPAAKPADAREPQLGEIVLFLARPGEGARECVSLVTRVHSPVLVDLLVMPPGHQPVVQTGISRRTPRNDRHVWEFRTDSATISHAAVEKAVEVLEGLKGETGIIAGLTASLSAAHDEIALLRKRFEDFAHLVQAKNDVEAEAPRTFDGHADRDRMRAEAEELGIVVDKRWGADRLQREIDTALQQPSKPKDAA